MLKPRQIAEALPDVTARKAGDWLRGDRSPSVVALARILEAFPDLDARAFVVELAILRKMKQATKTFIRLMAPYERVTESRYVESGDPCAPWKVCRDCGKQPLVCHCDG